MKDKEFWKRIGRQFVPNAGTIVIVVLFLVAQQAGALDFLASPAGTGTTTISYQGRLADSVGDPVNDTVGMTFRIYNVATGGSPLWTETYAGVQVSDGLFHVLLGSTAPLPESLFADNDTLYLGITVGIDSEMTPREQLASAPWAISVPDGSITTAKLAESSVTDVYFSSSGTSLELQEDNQWHDDPALSVTADFSGGEVLILLDSPGTWCNTGGRAIDTRILVDGVSVAHARTSFQTSAGYSERQTSINWFQALTPGTHTIKVQWQAETGIDIAVAGAASTRTLTVLELKR